MHSCRPQLIIAILTAGYFDGYDGGTVPDITVVEY
jgi:hypothetical protein